MASSSRPAGKAGPDYSSVGHLPEHDLRTARRDQLVDAAVRVIRRIGPRASMEQMAAEAGVTKPILYRHFGDRAGLYQAIAQRFVATIKSQLLERFANETTPRARLYQGIDSYLSFVESEPNLYRFLRTTRQVEHPAPGVALAGFVRQVGEELVGPLAHGLVRSGFDEAPAEAWAHGIVGMVHAAGDWWMDHGTMSRQALVLQLGDLLWNGLRRTGPSRTGPSIAELASQAAPGPDSQTAADPDTLAPLRR